MDKQALWDAYVRKNPSFITDGANLSADGLKKFFDTTYNNAYAQGKHDVSDKRSSGSSPFEQMFGLRGV
jgi:hypothetical protein